MLVLLVVLLLGAQALMICAISEKVKQVNYLKEKRLEQKGGESKSETKKQEKTKYIKNW